MISPSPTPAPNEILPVCGWANALLALGGATTLGYAAVRAWEVNDFLTTPPRGLFHGLEYSVRFGLVWALAVVPVAAVLAVGAGVSLYRNRGNMTGVQRALLGAALVLVGPPVILIATGWATVNAPRSTGPGGWRSM